MQPKKQSGFEFYLKILDLLKLLLRSSMLTTKDVLLFLAIQFLTPAPNTLTSDITSFANASLTGKSTSNSAQPRTCCPTFLPNSFLVKLLKGFGLRLEWENSGDFSKWE